MPDFTIDGRAIEIGYVWRQTLKFTDEILPAGSRYLAHVRRNRVDTAPLAVLTTENGGLAISGGNELEVTIPAAATAAMKPGHVLMDFVRVDVTPHEPLGVAIRVPVEQPVTRPA